MGDFTSDLEPILNCEKRRLEGTMRVTLRLGLGLNMINAYHLLSDRVVCSLQIAEHLSHNLLGVASIAHCVQQICRPLPDTHISLSLGQRQRRRISKH